MPEENTIIEMKIKKRKRKKRYNRNIEKSKKVLVKRKIPAGHNCLPPVRDRLAGRNDLHKGEH